MQDFKVCSSFLTNLLLILRNSQNKLEAQYAAKRDAHLSEVADLKQQLEMRGNEIRTLNGSIDSLKSVNEELKVRRWKLAAGRVSLTMAIACFCRNICWYRGWQESCRERAGP
jgi:hypothetical protein